MAKLTARFVATVTLPGKYTDEHGLILRVAPGGSKQWIWRGTVRGRRRDLGLGAAAYTSLAEARQTAYEYRKLARSGGDPTDLRRPKVPDFTFAEAAERVIALHAPNWRDPRREQNWRSSLERLAYPRLGHKPVAEIDAADILAVVGPLWADKRETARKLLGRVRTVLRWAVAEGLRSDEPSDAVRAALPRNGAVVRHHEALSPAQVGANIAAVRASTASDAVKGCYEIVMLCAVRSGEARGAVWSEFDLAAATWTIPPERYKTAAGLRVPLSERALQVLEAARERTGGNPDDYVFRAPRGGALTAEALSTLVRRLDLPGSVHGARASLRSWCAEEGVDREVAEQMLGHVPQGVAGAYQQSDMLEARRGVAERWAIAIAASPEEGIRALVL